MKLGLVADTHDHLDPALTALFEGCALILHAGDVTRRPVLDALSRVAPVRAVRGNNDRGAFGASLPELDWVEAGALTILLVHILGARQRPSPGVARALARRPAEVVVYGHSHRPGAELRDGRLFVNPGSAGKRRFRLPRSAGLLEVTRRDATVSLFDLAVSPAAPLQTPSHARL